MLGFVIYTGLHDSASAWQVTLGLIIGIVAGKLSARIFKISWDTKARHVTSTIDIAGVIVLILYIIFVLLKNNIAELFATNGSVAAMGLAIAAGGIYGRSLSNLKKIIRILREQQVWRITKKRPPK